MKWVLELQGGYMAVFSAKDEKAAERKGKQIVLDRYFGGVREAEQRDLDALHAMGGTEID